MLNPRKNAEIENKDRKMREAVMTTVVIIIGILCIFVCGEREREMNVRAGHTNFLQKNSFGLRTISLRKNPFLAHHVLLGPKLHTILLKFTWIFGKFWENLTFNNIYIVIYLWKKREKKHREVFADISTWRPRRSSSDRSTCRLCFDKD